MKLLSSPKAIAFIKDAEGYDQPSVFVGKASGVTIGIGYDLGQEKSFRNDWSGRIPDADIHALSVAIGARGSAAQQLCRTFHGIHIPYDVADDVFLEITLPSEEAKTIKAFPNSIHLPGDAFGGLVSLVYNFGPGLVDIPGNHPRNEMRGIAAILQRPIDGGTLDNIANLVACMAGYWKDNPNSDGDLHDRRLAEARLIRNALWSVAQHA